MECPGIRELVAEGEVLRLEIATGIVENLTRNAQRTGTKMPEFLQAIVRSGGIMERLRGEGYF
jgi:3-isopropylmalate/(R)-2-methylmalate dehydratase small subunit